MQKKYRDKGLVIVALTDEPDSVAKPFAKKQKMDYIIGMSAKGVSRAYGVEGLPTMYLIDPSGRVAYRGVGYHDAKALEEIVDKVLKETPPKDKSPISNQAAKKALAQAEEFLENKEFVKAQKEFEKLAKTYKDNDVGHKAEAKLKALKNNKEAQAAIKKAEMKKNCENLLQLARNLAKGGKDEEAAKQYQKIIDEYPDTPYAETALREIASLKP